MTTATKNPLTGKTSRRSNRRREWHEYTPSQKKEIRATHRETLDKALEALTEPLGMSRWLVSRHIHGKSHTPANIALAAFQAPGELTGTYRQWSDMGLKPRKGQVSELVLTGRTFWPVAAWTGSSYNIEMPALPTPCREHCAKLAALWLSWPDHSTQGLDAWIEETRPELIEGEAVEAGESPDIPW